MNTGRVKGTAEFRMKIGSPVARLCNRWAADCLLPERSKDELTTAAAPQFPDVPNARRPVPARFDFAARSFAEIGISARSGRGVERGADAVLGPGAAMVLGEVAPRIAHGEFCC